MLCPGWQRRSEYISSAADGFLNSFEKINMEATRMAEAVFPS